MKIALTFIVLLHINLLGFGQLTANKLIHDFGDVNESSNRTADFFVVNTYNFTITLTSFVFDLELSTASVPVSVEPGDTLFYRAKINPKKIGPFEKTISLYFFQLSDTINLTLKANVISTKFKDGASVERFPENRGKNQEKFNHFPVEFLVIDEDSQLPVKNVSISFSAKSPSYELLKTDANGRAERVLNNRYDVNFNAYGYRAKRIEISVGCHDSLRTVKLAKIKPNEKTEQDYIYEYEGKNPIKIEGDTIANLDEAQEKTILTPFEKGHFKPNNIVFLMDVSISMKDHNRITLLKSAIIQLVNLLREKDNVSIITFSENTTTLVPPTFITGENRKQIIRLIENLKPTGLTNGGRGLKTAFKLMNENYDPTKNNQVILATDGALGGYMKHEDMLELVKKNAAYATTSVITLNGYNWSGKFMHEIATAGKGKLIPINNEKEARLSLVQEIKANSIIKTD